MSLPLKVRKNIKDNEDKQKEALERLNESELGGEWSFECDYENAYKLAVAAKGKEADCAERIGEFIIGDLDTITRNIVRFIESSPLKLEVVKDSVTAHKITYHIIDKVKLPKKRGEADHRDKFQAKVENGGLVFQVAKGEYPPYIDQDFSIELQTAFDEPDSLPLLSRVSIAENQDKLEELKESLKAATGEEFEVDIDYAQIIKDWKKAKKDVSTTDLDDVGKLMINEYLSALVRNIERLCKDDLTKEAFVEAVNKKSIRFQVYTRTRAEKDSFYARSKIVDGALVIQLDSENFPANVDETGGDLEKLL